LTTIRRLVDGRRELGKSGLAVKLEARALPMRLLTAMRPALFDRYAIGPFPDLALGDPAGVFNR
jgi:hypothetical protein